MPVIIRKKNGQSLKIINYFFGFIFFAWLIAGATWFYDIYRDRNLGLTLKSPVEFYSTSDLKFESKSGIISPSDHVKVLRVLFLNDHLVIHVQLQNGQRGWILKTDEVNLK